MGVASGPMRRTLAMLRYPTYPSSTPLVVHPTCTIPLTCLAGVCASASSRGRPGLLRNVNICPLCCQPPPATCFK